MTNRLILMNAVLVVAHAVESVLGFGATITAFGLGLYLFQINTLLVVLVLLALLQSTWLVIRWFTHIEWKKIYARILPVALLGVIVGILLRDRFDEAGLKLILGLFILVLASAELVLMAVSRKRTSRNLPKGAGLALILTGGIFHGLLTIGGPLIVYYASRQLSSQGSIRGTLAFIWLILNIVMLGGFLLDGRITGEVLKMTGMLLPGFAAGILAGSLLKVRDDIFRIVTYVMLMLIAVSILVPYF